MNNRIQIQIPLDWPHSHIPTWEYDEDGDLEVSNFTCGTCKYIGDRCKCINHEHIHFFRPYFSCDVTTSLHTICKAYEPDFKLFPAGRLEYEALGGFDEWYRIWVKQWHYNRNPPWSKICLIRAKQVKDREHSDDRYYISYDDFINCNIMKDEGIHCLDYAHIEVSRKSVTGYKWVHENSGLWIPWEGNKYIHDS